LNGDLDAKLASCIPGFSRFWRSCFDPFFFGYQRRLDYLVFQPFDYERTQ
jgi:hypothetical protein